MITHSPQAGGVYEGFGNYYNHLLCGVETDPVSLCFRALKAGEARRSRFQHKRLYTIVRAEEKKPHCWPKLTSFFLNNSTCVLALGKRRKKGGNITVCSEEGSWKQDPESAFQPSSQLPGPPGSYLRRLPA
uniref:Uncharacterized protein n=1 Tax=Molossus molossus TaxID=27622 RepID=A0A7J8F976_MOLMO|nr:hypothetical protein HJG59_008586 [Molossus molossus]